MLFCALLLFLFCFFLLLVFLLLLPFLLLLLLAVLPAPLLDGKLLLAEVLLLALASRAAASSGLEGEVSLTCDAWPPVHYGLTGGWVQKFKASYLGYPLQCVLTDYASGKA